MIDVRDIEEVDTGPLMEELGLDEETAQKVVDLCVEEAKIVAVESEAKKAADAIKKADQSKPIRLYVVANDQGYLSSVAFSPVLGQDIGIGFLARGRERIGKRIRAVDLLRGHDVECVVCSPVFYDPEGTRTHG